jgi:hypothetical protein
MSGLYEAVASVEGKECADVPTELFVGARLGLDLRVEGLFRE